ncbi:MAG TPA: hypothetical protein VFC38_04255 [Stellaceae bacterium]|nr:hypothetical protein [Stellaceae bacterium]
MLKRWHAVGAVIVAAGLLAWMIAASLGAESPQAHRGAVRGQPPQTNSASANQAAPQDQRGTDQSPLIVKLRPPDKGSDEANQDSRDRLEKSANDRSLVRFTGILAVMAVLQFLALIGQGFVFWLQAKRLEQTIESAEIAQRPYLFIGDVKQQIVPTNPEQILKWEHNHVPELSFNFRNNGKTPAIFEEVHGQLVLLDKLPDKPDYKMGIIERGMSIVGAGATSPLHLRKLGMQKKEPDGKAPSETDWQEFEAKRKTFYLIGYVRYTDIFGRIHTTGFGFELSPKVHRFAAVGGNAYNYRKTETPKTQGKLARLFKVTRSQVSFPTLAP